MAEEIAQLKEEIININVKIEYDLLVLSCAHTHYLVLPIRKKTVLGWHYFFMLFQRMSEPIARKWSCPTVEAFSFDQQTTSSGHVSWPCYRNDSKRLEVSSTAEFWSKLTRSCWKLYSLDYRYWVFTAIMGHFVHSFSQQVSAGNFENLEASAKEWVGYNLTLHNLRKGTADIFELSFDCGEWWPTPAYRLYAFQTRTGSWPRSAPRPALSRTHQSCLKKQWDSSLAEMAPSFLLFVPAPTAKTSSIISHHRRRPTGCRKNESCTQTETESTKTAAMLVSIACTGDTMTSVPSVFVWVPPVCALLT